MCRFLAYRGRSICVDDLLFQPVNSLIRQSAHAHEMKEPLNGDGFGIGWYAKEIDPDPGVFVSVRHAWNDRNLRYIAPKIRSDCIFAHVRAASHGEVSETNCHPFHYRQYLFMHNGNIDGFHHVKRFLRRRLSDEVYEWIRGQTDSEHFFALLLENLGAKREEAGEAEMVRALKKSFAEIEEIKKRHQIREPSYLNLAVTDGNYVVATRYVSRPRLRAPTLYYSEGSQYEIKDGICRMRRSDPKEHTVLIVSERLTNRKGDWKKIHSNHMLVVHEDLRVRLSPL
ncbi:MAG: class II glutamine amidotransferase [Deltaproteobacteria bacterium]|nr:class II glutamine amidotransferase [Deltaproteobacteria bacterium]